MTQQTDRELNIRMRGDDVKALQEALTARGYSVTDKPGYFGKETKQAIEEIQKRQGLPVTGVVDPDFFERITDPSAMNKQLHLSPTVKGIREQLVEQTSVHAVEIIESILGRHSDYAKKTPRPNLAPTENAPQRPIDEWLAGVRTLFSISHTPDLHGKLVIIGLSMLEPDLKQQLQTHDFLAALAKELKEPLESILTEDGRRLWHEPGPASVTAESKVPNHPDDPLRQTEDDRLGREAYARFLAERIFAVGSQHAYAMHVYGPWGAGKSTLLNFLRTKLQQKQWLVVEFNAWQNQHIRPPWWALLDRVFQDSKQLARVGRPSARTTTPRGGPVDEGSVYLSHELRAAEILGKQ